MALTCGSKGQGVLTLLSLGYSVQQFSLELSQFAPAFESRRPFGYGSRVRPLVAYLLGLEGGTALRRSIHQ